MKGSAETIARGVFHDPKPDMRGGGWAQHRRYAWVMLALLWLLYVVFGLAQRAIAPLVTPIVDDLDLSYTQMGFILGSWQLAFIVVSLGAGSMIDRWGIRRSLFAGAMSLGLSLFLRYFVTGFGTLLGAVALSGVGGPMISIGCPKAISVWFTGRSRSTAVGIYLTGSWVGSICALTLTNGVVMPLVGYSWRRTFLLYGIVTFAVGLLWLYLARDADRKWDENAPGMISLFYRFIKVRDVAIALMLGLLTFACLHALLGWLPKILETGGLSPAIAGLAAAIPLAAGIPSLLIVPRLIPPPFRGRFLALFSVLSLVALVLIMTTSGGLQILALILFGVANSPIISILTLVLMDAPEIGSDYMGAAGGMFYCVSEIGGFTGPLIMGTIVDLTGSFFAGTLFFACLCITASILALFLGAASGPRSQESRA